MLVKIIDFYRRMARGGWSSHNHYYSGSTAASNNNAGWLSVVCVTSAPNGERLFIYDLDQKIFLSLNRDQKRFIITNLIVFLFIWNELVHLSHLYIFIAVASMLSA
jgi:hypothetical protein